MIYVIQLTSTFGNEYTNEPMYDRFLGYYAADGRACEQVVSFKNSAKFPTKEKAEFVARHMVHLGANNVAKVMSEVEAEKWIA